MACLALVCRVRNLRGSSFRGTRGSFSTRRFQRLSDGSNETQLCISHFCEPIEAMQTLWELEQIDPGYREYLKEFRFTGDLEAGQQAAALARSSGSYPSR
jgi:hypothetical protein